MLCIYILRLHLNFKKISPPAFLLTRFAKRSHFPKAVANLLRILFTKSYILSVLKRSSKSANFKIYSLGIAQNDCSCSKDLLNSSLFQEPFNKTIQRDCARPSRLLLSSRRLRYRSHLSQNRTCAVHIRLFGFHGF